MNYGSRRVFLSSYCFYLVFCKLFLFLLNYHINLNLVEPQIGIYLLWNHFEDFSLDTISLDVGKLTLATLNSS